MQGVEQMGDYSIQLRLKVMTKPGEQFGLRRKAYALIKKAFEENGIKFATPTVTVAGGSPQSAAVAARREFEQTPPAAGGSACLITSPRRCGSARARRPRSAP